MSIQLIVVLLALILPISLGKAGFDFNKMQIKIDVGIQKSQKLSQWP